MGDGELVDVLSFGVIEVDFLEAFVALFALGDGGEGGAVGLTEKANFAQCFDACIEVADATIEHNNSGEVVLFFLCELGVATGEGFGHHGVIIGGVGAGVEEAVLFILHALNVRDDHARDGIFTAGIADIEAFYAVGNGGEAEVIAEGFHLGAPVGTFCHFAGESVGGICVNVLQVLVFDASGRRAHGDGMTRLKGEGCADGGCLLCGEWGGNEEVFGGSVGSIVLQEERGESFL